MSQTTPLPDAPGAQSGRSRAMGLMIVSSVTISFGGLVIRMMEGADVWQIGLYRSIVIIALIGTIMIWRYGNGALAKVRGIGWAGVAAGLMLSAAGIFYLQAITNTTVANTLFTLSAIPFFTAALARVLLGERLKRVTLLTMILAACGITIMVAGSITAGSAYGNLMALATALCFSGYAIIVRRNRGIEMLPVLIVSSGVMALICVGVALPATGGAGLPVSLHDLAFCVVLGLMSGSANAFMIAAARHLVAAELTLFMLLEFALGPLWVWLIIAERPGPGTLIGGSVVIAAVTLRALGELGAARRSSRRPVPPRAM